MSVFKRSCVVVLLLMVISTCYAGNPVEKLGRGVANVIFSPMELLMKPYDTAQEQGNVAGITYGVFRGVCYTVARIGVGVADICTFFMPLPGCTDTPYDVGWGYGPMAFRESPWVVDAEHNWGDFFYESDSMVKSDF